MLTHVVAVDHVRARFFRLVEASFAAGGELRSLEELEDLIHPERGLDDAELFSTTKPGGRSEGEHSDRLDDHRDAHRDEADRKFARRVIKRLDELARGNGATRVLLCSGPQMKGHLRDALRARPAGPSITEVNANIARLTAPRILDQLVVNGVLSPPAPRPTRN